MCKGSILGMLQYLLYFAINRLGGFQIRLLALDWSVCVMAFELVQVAVA
jgi:hypothetical protein